MLLTPPYLFLGLEASQSLIISSCEYCSANWHFSWPLLPHIGQHVNCSSRLIHIFFTENVLRLHGEAGRRIFAPQQLQSIIQPPLFLSRGSCNQSFHPYLHEGAASFLFVLLWYVDLLRLLLLGVGDVAMLHLTINQLTSSIWTLPKLQRTSIILQQGLRIRIIL